MPVFSGRSPRGRPRAFRVLALPPILVALSLAPKAAAVSREEAIATVVSAIIDTSQAKLALDAYTFQCPVDAGTVIAQDVTDTIATTADSTWLFWLDLDPDALFAHPTKFVLVSRITGAITAVVDGQFWPTIGDSVYYRDQIDRETTADLFWSYGAPVAKRGALPKRAAIANRTADPAPVASALEAAPPSAGPDLLAGSWGLIVCPYDTSKNAGLAVDVRCAKSSFDLLTGSGKRALAPVTIVVNQSKAQTCAAIDALPDNCTKLYVCWIGHGRPDSLRFPGGESLTAHEFACKLKAQGAAEFCVIVETCYSGSVFDDLTEKGVNGYHMTSTDATTTAKYFRFGSRIGSWFAVPLWDCIAAGRRGPDAFAWSALEVEALKDSLLSSPDSLHYKNRLGDSNPTGAHVKVFGKVGAGAGASGAGEPFHFTISPRCSTVIVSFPGGTSSDTSGSFTLTRAIASGGDTAWTKAGTFDWNLSKSVRFRAFAGTGATGEFEIAMHSNRAGVRALVAGEPGTAAPTTPLAVTTLNSGSIGWVNSSGAEFDTTLGKGTNGIGSFGWSDGNSLGDIPAITGPGWYAQVYASIPLRGDPDRPQLYVGGDSLQGFLEETYVILEAASLRDPGGNGSADSATVQLEATQPGFVSTFAGTFRAIAAPGPAPGPGPSARSGAHSAGLSAAAAGAIPPLIWNLGTIKPVPLNLHTTVVGPAAVEWDALLIIPASASGTMVPTPSISAAQVRLHPNAPNPFNPSTIVRFDLEAPGFVRLAIFDASGRLVRTLLAEPTFRGFHAVGWDGRADGGTRVGAGVYLCRLEAEGRAETVKMTLLR